MRGLPKDLTARCTSSTTTTSTTYLIITWIIFEECEVVLVVLLLMLLRSTLCRTTTKDVLVVVFMVVLLLPKKGRVNKAEVLRSEPLILAFHSPLGVHQPLTLKHLPSVTLMNYSCCTLWRYALGSVEGVKSLPLVLLSRPVDGVGIERLKGCVPTHLSPS